MGKFLKGFGGIAIFVGIMALAGAAGDCDGKCGPGNDLATMLTIIGYAFIGIMGGAAALMAGIKLDEY